MKLCVKTSLGLAMVCLLASTSLSLDSRAAEVKIVGSRECAVRLTGPISSGDRDKVEAGLQEASRQQDGAGSGGYIRNTVVCLSSPGGSYDEGLKLAQYFIEQAVQTYVEDGGSCYSACAVAFMGGTENHYESVYMPSRNLHINGVLGFHAPFLRLPSGEYSEQTVQNSYAAAFTALGKLAGMGKRRNSTDPIIDPTLIALLAEQGPEQAFLIDTVGKAARFGIALVGAATPQKYTASHFCNVCLNRFGVKRAHDIGQDQCGAPDRSRDGNVLFFGGYGDGGEIDGVCAIQQRRELANQYASGPGVCREVIYDESNSDPPQRDSDVAQCTFINIDPFEFYPPTTPTKQLPPSLEPIRFRFDSVDDTGPVTLPEPAAPSGPTLWNHNGSTMKLVADGASRRFYYESPRQGIRAQGVTTGTLLFDGTKSGEAYFGTAYIFSGRCGKVAYQVSGLVAADQRRVVMRGQAPRLSNGCQVAGYKDDLLVFDYLSAAEN